MARKTRKLSPRGQAMIEYSMINWVLVVALCFVSTAPVFPQQGLRNGARGGENLIELFLRAYQTYYDSYYFVLNLPFP